MYMTMIMLSILALVLLLRGGKLHNYLVLETEHILQQAGFQTHQEHPQHLPDGTDDFIDLLAQQGDFMLCIEVETTARHVLINADKADQLDLPLIVVVPNRNVQKAVKRKLNLAQVTADGQPIYILLLDQLKQQVMNCFPLFSPANKTRKNKKTNNMKEMP